MFYKSLLFVLLLCGATFYIVVGGITHDSPGQIQSGSTSWEGVTPGNSSWENETDESADHPTISVYASAVVTNWKRVDDNDSGSGDDDIYDQSALGHARVSAETLTITIGDGEPEIHEPQGKVSHLAFVYLVFVDQQGFEVKGVLIEGDNNVLWSKYFGPYNEMTSAYNSPEQEHQQEENWYLKGYGSGVITNVKEDLLKYNTRAEGEAEAP